MTTLVKVSWCVLLCTVAVDVAAQSCAAPTAVQRVELAGADTVLALPAAYTSNALTVTGGDRALSFEADTDTLSGFIIDIPIASSGTPTNEAASIASRLTSAAGRAALGASSSLTADAGTVITTHDGFGAVRSIRVNLTLTAPADRRTLRNRVMAVAGNHALADFAGLVIGGSTSTQYAVQLSVLVRPGMPQRLRVVGAVGDRTLVDDAAQLAGSAADDLTDGGPLARTSIADVAVCNPDDVTPAPVDLLIANYTGGSLGADRANTLTAVGAIHDALSAAGADLRVGVVPHQSNSFQLGSGNGGVLRSGFQRDRQTALNEVADVTGTNGCDFVLTAGDNAIDRALPRTAPGMETAAKLRSDAQLVVLYVDGEHAQEIEQNECGLGTLGTGQNPGTRSTPSAAQNAVITTILTPFLNKLAGENALAFGVIGPLEAPFCATQPEDGRGYFEAINARGGDFALVCDTSFSAFAATIARVTLPLTTYVDRPIASSLRVQLFVDGTGAPVEVPRSRVDGYELDRDQVAVQIRGATYRPQPGDRVEVTARLWASALFADGFE